MSCYAVSVVMGVQSKPSRSQTQRIAEAVADAEGVDVVTLDPPLFEVLDGDLLDGLIRSNELSETDATLHVSFEYHGYTVQVAADGRVSVEQ